MSAPLGPFHDVADALAAWPKNGPLMGLDLGTKTIGVAISDGLRGVATAVETIRRAKFAADAERLDALAAERGACGLVLGLPVNMDGSEGPRAQSTRAFARNLAQRQGPSARLSVLFWDERLSTVAVERALLEADASRKRRAEVVDKMAAAYILQGVLDRIQNIEKTRRSEDDDAFWRR